MIYGTYWNEISNFSIEFFADLLVWLLNLFEYEYFLLLFRLDITYAVHNVNEPADNYLVMNE